MISHTDITVKHQLCLATTVSSVICVYQGTWTLALVSTMREINFCPCTQVLRKLEQLGWDPLSSDGHLTRLLRGQLIGLLPAVCVGAGSDLMVKYVLAECRARFNAFAADTATEALPSEYQNRSLEHTHHRYRIHVRIIVVPRSLNAAPYEVVYGHNVYVCANRSVRHSCGCNGRRYQAAVYKLYLGHGGSVEYEQLVELYARLSTDEEKKQCLVGLVSSLPHQRFRCASRDHSAG
jgi:hypothetical protein